MSEQETKARELPEVQAQYQALCTRAGHIQYQIEVLSTDLDLLNKNLRDLNLEAAAIQAKATEQSVAAKAAEATGVQTNA